MSFAFSLDGRQFAYTRQQDSPSVIFLRDIATGIEKKAQVAGASKNYVLVGDINWSPNGKELVFQTQTADYMVQTILLDPARMKQKVIREYKLENIWFEGWTLEGKFRFFENGEVVVLNPKTGETLAIGTPTHEP